MKTRTAALMSLLVIMSASTAQADLIITISDATVTAGQASFVDVFVSSDGTDSFQNYFLDFTSTTPGFFQESAIPAPQLTATSPDYIFLGNSLEEDLQLGLDFVTDDLTSSVLTALDETFDAADRTISSTDGNFLLARLNFIAPASGTFDIELDTLTSGFFDFDDDESAFIDIAGSDLTATITANAAVPEPSSFACLFLMCVGCSTRRRSRSSI